jgi:FtsZ-binding cell division protein ZapB
MMQIREIVLYSWTGKRRRLPLRLNAVNIITGDSATGKTALTDIIDYCLGSGTCDVPRGKITETVAWYALLLQVNEFQVFVARQAPEEDAQSSQRVFVKQGASVGVPDYAELTPTTNADGLISLLSRLLSFPDTGNAELQGLPNYSVTLRHAAFFLYQQQDEIISRQRLFHRQGEPFVSNSIRETLPFFLGAITAEDVRVARRINRLKKKIRDTTREVADLEAAADRGGTRARQLLAEAASAGLTTANASGEDSSNVDALAELRAILALRQNASDRSTETDSAQLGDADNARQGLLQERDLIRRRSKQAQSSLESIATLLNDRRNFERQAAEQRSRLAFVQLIPDAGIDECPLCGSHVDGQQEEIDELREHFSSLSRIPQALPSESPRLKALADTLKQEIEECQQAIRSNSAQLEAIERASERDRNLALQENVQAAVVGRIDFYLEGVGGDERLRLLKQELESLRVQLEAAENEVDSDLIRDRTLSILSRLNQLMTNWSSQLPIEHSSNPLRFDIKKLQIILDTPSGPLAMPQIGSGQSWVAYHVLVHMALHEWFAEHNRPVPGFVFFDQPSQVGFPADSEYRDNDAVSGDRNTIAETFRFIIDAAGRAAKPYQIIIAEHADFDEQWFQDCVREKWRNGKALIPQDW